MITIINKYCKTTNPSRMVIPPPVPVTQPWPKSAFPRIRRTVEQSTELAYQVCWMSWTVALDQFVPRHFLACKYGKRLKFQVIDKLFRLCAILIPTVHFPMWTRRSVRHDHFFYEHRHPPSYKKMT